MILKQDKCLNCGASINYDKIENGVYRCPFCREYYHIDQYGMIEEYKVKLKYMGKILYCYLGSVQCDYIYDSYRDIKGQLVMNRPLEPTFKIELISYLIEDEKGEK